MGSKNFNAWHFLGPQKKLRYPPYTPIIVGETLTVTTPLVMCEHGLHASARALDALKYAPRAHGLIICRVRLSGGILTTDDKAVATERTVLWMADADRTLYGYALWCAELAILDALSPDSAPATRFENPWLAGEATNEIRRTREAPMTSDTMRFTWDAIARVIWSMEWGLPTSLEVFTAELERRLWLLRPEPEEEK